jgi:hypothetical protein
LDGNTFSTFHWPLKDEEAIDWCKRISKLSLDKGNKLKEGIEVTYEIRVFLKGAQNEVFSSIFKKSL